MNWSEPSPAAILSLEEIIELEQEALAETGNIILNGCMATIANLLERSLKMSMPEILRGNGPEFFSLPPPPAAGDVVVFLHIDFSIKQRDINGYIVMLMDMPSIEALSGLLGEFIARTTDAAALSARCATLRAPSGAASSMPWTAG